MSDLHAIFRSTGEAWDAYSRPVSIHAAGRTLDQARDEFDRAGQFHFGADWALVDVHDHLERQAVSGVFARVAVDRHTLERDSTEQLLRLALRVPAQLDHLRLSAPESSTGDVVFVCCVAADPLEWVIDQMGRTDAVQVCVTAAGQMLWWTTLAAPDSGYSKAESETLGEIGLAGASVTIGDLIRSEGHRNSRDPESKAGRRSHPVGRKRRPTMQGRSRALVVSR